MMESTKFWALLIGSVLTLALGLVDACFYEIGSVDCLFDEAHFSNQFSFDVQDMVENLQEEQSLVIASGRLEALSKVVKRVADAFGRRQPVLLLHASPAFKDQVLSACNVPFSSSNESSTESVAFFLSHISGDDRVFRIIDVPSRFEVTQSVMTHSTNGSVSGNVQEEGERSNFHKNEISGLATHIKSFLKFCRMQGDVQGQCKQHLQTVLGNDYYGMNPPDFDGERAMYARAILSMPYSSWLGYNGRKYVQKVSNVINYNLFWYKTQNPNTYSLTVATDGMHATNAFTDCNESRGFFQAALITVLKGVPIVGQDLRKFRWERSGPKTQNGDHTVSTSFSVEDKWELFINLAYENIETGLARHRAVTLGYEATCDISDMMVIEKTSPDMGAWIYHMAWPVDVTKNDFGNFPTTYKNWYYAPQYEIVRDLPPLVMDSSQSHGSMTWVADPSLKASDGTLWIHIHGSAQAHYYMVVKGSGHHSMYRYRIQLVKAFHVNLAYVDSQQNDTSPFTITN